MLSNSNAYSYSREPPIIGEPGFACLRMSISSLAEMVDAYSTRSDEYIARENACRVVSSSNSCSRRGRWCYQVTYAGLVIIGRGSNHALSVVRTAECYFRLSSKIIIARRRVHFADGEQEGAASALSPQRARGLCNHFIARWNQATSLKFISENIIVIQHDAIDDKAYHIIWFEINNYIFCQ